MDKNANEKKSTYRPKKRSTRDEEAYMKAKVAFEDKKATEQPNREKEEAPF